MVSVYSPAAALPPLFDLVGAAGRQGWCEQEGVAAVDGLGGCQQQRHDQAIAGVLIVADDRKDLLERVTGGIKCRRYAACLAETVPAAIRRLMLAPLVDSGRGTLPALSRSGAAWRLV